MESAGVPARGSTTCPCRYHEQYLGKNQFGYRCHTNTGTCFPQTASRPMVERDLIVEASELDPS